MFQLSIYCDVFAELLNNVLCFLEKLKRSIKNLLDPKGNLLANWSGSLNSSPHCR